MTTSPLWMKALAKLADQHYDVAVLAQIQSELSAQAIENRMLKGYGTESHEDLKGARLEAEALLPTGLELQSLYFQRRAGISLAPTRELETAAKTLTLCAEQLEKISGQVLAKGLKVADFAKAESAIGDRYAQIIRAARTLESNGVIPVLQREQLAKLSERPAGPLAAFFDKAMTLLEHHDQQPKMRMAA